MVERFRDDGRDIYDFTNEFLIKCPGCSKCATIFSTPKNGAYFIYEKRKLICTHCGHIEEKKNMNGIGISEYPLWLEINCCGEKLWAYNIEHLNFLENYVRAEIREDHRDGEFGWKNRSLVSRLPKWIKNAHKREEILKCIKNLRDRI